MKLATTLPTSENPATGFSLTDDVWTQATDITMMADVLISRLPTSPHVIKLYTVSFKGYIINWTTPDTIVEDSGIRYFRSLVEYQTRSGLIEPKDASKYKFAKLAGRMKFEIRENDLLTASQKAIFLKILRKLSKSVNVSINNLSIKVSADNELAVYKMLETGTSLIVVGDIPSDISYVFISKEAGKYNTVHVTEENGIDKIIDLFISA